MIFLSDLLRIIQGNGSDRVQRPDGVFVHSETAQGNAADTTDDVLFTMALPIRTMFNPGDVVRLEAIGHTLNNANNKEIKVWVGPDVQTLGAAIVTTATTKIADSNVVTTNNGGWKADAVIWKKGAYGANTQTAYGSILTGVTTGAISSEKPVALTLNEALVNYITVTGASGTTGNAADVVGDLARVSISNGG